MWQYPSFEARKKIREQAWTKEGWSTTVSKVRQQWRRVSLLTNKLAQTAELATVMDASILLPLPYSPLK